MTTGATVTAGAVGGTASGALAVGHTGGGAVPSATEDVINLQQKIIK